MNSRFAAALMGLSVGVSAAALPAGAHHAFDAEFDIKKPVTLQGTIAKVEWTNPHSWLYLDAKDKAGKVTRWQCELASPNQLRRQGWSRNSVNVGDRLIIEGSQARKNATTCHARVVKTLEGKRLFGGEGPGS